jgi:protoporphyrin/coproporphyrin ferrochelatase
MKAILLMAYGSPEREEDVEAYYTHIRGGRKPTPEELENLKTRYRAIGGKSPLYRITGSTAEKLEARLDDVKVYAGMKHWHPFITEIFDQMSGDGVTELLAVALAPHYSKMSIGGYQTSVEKANEDHGGKIKLAYVNQWHLNSVFIEKWWERILKAVDEKFHGVDRDEIFFLFSAHSLPERILTWQDPYKDQLLETADKLAQELKLARHQYGFAFQSAGHTSEPWLGPDILDKLKELSNNGWKNVLIIPIGFVSDHLEILFDIDVEAKQLAKELGIHVERTESFNDSEDFIDVLASVVRMA